MKQWKVEVWLRAHCTEFLVDAESEADAKEEALECAYENLETGTVEEAAAAEQSS